MFNIFKKFKSATLAEKFGFAGWLFLGLFATVFLFLMISFISSEIMFGIITALAVALMFIAMTLYSEYKHKIYGRIYSDLRNYCDCIAYKIIICFIWPVMLVLLFIIILNHDYRYQKPVFDEYNSRLVEYVENIEKLERIYPEYEFDYLNEVSHLETLLSDVASANKINIYETYSSNVELYEDIDEIAKSLKLTLIDFEQYLKSTDSTLNNVIAQNLSQVFTIVTLPKFVSNRSEYVGDIQNNYMWVFYATGLSYVLMLIFVFLSLYVGKTERRRSYRSTKSC